MATRLIPVLYQAIDCNGDPGNGWKLWFYETGTTNLKDTYSNEALTVANANPVICNSDGRPANGAGNPVDIFGASKEDYKVILLDANDNVIETKDPVDTVTYDINSFGTRPAQHWGTTTGTAAAFRIKPVPSITVYSDDILFTIQMSLDNNAGSTLAVFEEGTVSTYLAALDMMKYDNAGAKTALAAGDNQAGQTYLYRLDGTDAVCLGLEPASTTRIGKVELATNAELVTATDTTRALTASNMKSLYTNSTLASGLFAFPITSTIDGAFTEMRITAKLETPGAPIAAGASLAVTFGVAFPTAVRTVHITFVSLGVNDVSTSPLVTAQSAAGFTIKNTDVDSTIVSFNYTAVGY